MAAQKGIEYIYIRILISAQKMGNTATSKKGDPAENGKKYFNYSFMEAVVIKS